MKLFLQKEQSLVNKPEGEGMTPLHCALLMYEDDDSIIKCLLENGADVNLKDN